MNAGAGQLAAGGGHRHARDADARRGLRALDRLGDLPYAGAVTLSIGGTLVLADEPLAVALERADEALYAVKEQGRDGYEVR